MLPASNAGAGMNQGFPDVCLTPMGPVTVPVPYPNMAMHATAVPFAEDVLVSFVPALNMAAEIPMTLGDEAGVASPNSGPGRFTMGNEVVMVNGVPAVNLTCPTTGNDMINAVGAVLVPSVTNVFFSQAPTRDGAPSPGTVSGACVERLARALGEPDVVQRPCPSGVMCIAVAVFSPCVPARIHGMLQRLDGTDPLDALVIDLRGCPGGELTAALELAGDFLEEGSVLVVATDDDGDETVHRARGGALYKFPLVVLVDRRTASAAEVFAGALQAHGRAFIVGEPSYGKGSAQALLSGIDHGVHYATVATLTLPNGAPIEGQGVTPDLLADDALGAAFAWRG
jgi:carboxyl-terminal processing protease